jgi:two-component system, NtrC family, sensor kinase
VAPDAQGQDERFTYAPLVIAGRPGALELSERLVSERSFTKRAVRDTVTATLALATATTLASFMLGLWFVARPIRALVDKARRIGRGEFEGAVHLRQRDELAVLAEELNETSDRLVEAREGQARETAARIAALEQLRHADRLMTVGKLASGVAHELGTPLNVVVARADMIASSEAAGEQARAYAAIIRDAATRMTTIIRQLLDFARRRGPKKESTDLGVLARHALDLLRPLAQRQGVALALAPSDGGCRARVDAAQIEQALTNLVVNAVQAIGHGASGGAVDVTVTRARAVSAADDERREADWVALRVRDNGAGIAPENLPHVFEPFFTTKDVGKGTGLGLSVAHGIVRDHGGWVDVASEPGHGSTFTLFLPSDTGGSS